MAHSPVISSFSVMSVAEIHQPWEKLQEPATGRSGRSTMPEGARLDYKGIALPRDLEKPLAAFANTLGGLIFLGVEANQTGSRGPNLLTRSFLGA
jgi:hypothetical protein